MNPVTYKVTWTTGLETEDGRRLYDIHDILTNLGIKPGDIVEVSIKKVGEYDIHKEDE